MLKQHRMAGVVIAACSLAPAFAQDTNKDKDRDRDRQPSTRQPADDIKNRSDIDRVKAGDPLPVPSSWAEGTTVVGDDNVQLRTVEDAIIRGRSGRVVYLLITKGIRPANSQAPDHPRALDRVSAIPFAAFSWDDDKKVLTLPVSEEQFKNAPSIELSQWRGVEDPDRADAAYRYFKIPDDRLALHRREYRPSRLNSPDRMDKMDKMDKKDRPMRTDKPDKADKTDRTKPDRINQPARDTGVLSRADTEKSLFTVKEIRNHPVRTEDGREFGTVNEVVFDAPSGRVAFLAVTPGSSMDAGEGKVAIPWPAFRVQPSGEVTVPNSIDKEALKNAPRLTRADWSDIGHDAYTEDLYKTYGYDSGYWRDSSVKTTRMYGKDRTDMKSTEKSINGKIESIEKSGKVVVINVKGDDGEMYTVHTASQAYLDQHKLSLRKGDTVRINAK